MSVIAEPQFDVLVKTKDGKLRSRMGPYTKEQAEKVAKFSKTYPTEVVPHDESALAKTKENRNGESEESS
jgi:hypothetical protein